MLRTLLRAFITALGTMALPGILMLIQTMYRAYADRDLFAPLPAWGPLVVYLLAGSISAFTFYLLSARISTAIENAVQRLEDQLKETPSMALLAGGIGLILGLIVAALFSVVIALIPLAWVSVPLTIIFYIIFGYLGCMIGIARRGDVSDYFSKIFSRGASPQSEPEALPKLLDASAVIDGRIFDVLKTGVFDGEIIVPDFVLAEIQKVADSEDNIKRARGRRGLDALSLFRKNSNVPITVTETHFPDALDNDVRIIKLARELNGKVITTDYSLNKVAQVQDIQVFNINDLANALKPALTAGEALRVRIVKQGKERGQGVAYLDDGTMIVVDRGADLMQSDVEVIVTSVLQTSAGRMIFAKPAEDMSGAGRFPLE